MDALAGVEDPEEKRKIIGKVFIDVFEREAIKADAKATSNSVKNAVRTDLQNKANQQTEAANKKRQQKINKIDKKITKLNKELASVKSNKKITETQRVIEMKKIQSQIDMYKRQKAAIQ